MYLGQCRERLLGYRLPWTEGLLDVPGINEPLTIRRDGWGVPHIDAATETDAWYGLGFCHGQDRALPAGDAAPGDPGHAVRP